MKSKIIKNIGNNSIRYPIDKICKNNILLTSEQEIHFSRKVRLLFKIINDLKNNNIKVEKSYGKVLIKWKDLESIYSLEEIKELKQKVKEGILARKILVEKNMRLVCSIASVFSKSGLSFEDLRQEGALGLQKGVDRFNPEQGCRLSTYVTFWIKQSIINALNEYSKTIRLPVHVTEILLKQDKIKTSLEQKLGRKPTEDEIIFELNKKENYNITVNKLRFLKERSKVPVSLYEPIIDDNNEGCPDYLLLRITAKNSLESFNVINKAYDPEYYTLINSFIEDINKEIDKLPEEQRIAIRMNFGLGKYKKPRILDDIAKSLNFTRDKARSTLYSGINNLRKNSKNVLIDYALSDEI